MLLPNAFDPNSVQPDEGFEVLPPGPYNVMIVDSSIDPTKKGDGQMLKLTLQIVDGAAANRLLFDRMLLEHPNPKAVDIAKRKLSALCHAVGEPNLVDSTQLHGKTVTAVVKVQAAKDGYEASNDVKGYKSLATAAAAPPVAVTPAAVAPVAATGSAPPPVAAPPVAPVAVAAPPATPPWTR